jgi:hypothetical protein
MVKVVFQGESAVAQLSRSLKRLSDDMGKRVRATMNDAADEILQRGREDMGQAGKFGSRWEQALTAEFESDDPKRVVLTIKMGIPYWTVFQEGKTILGKPLLYFKPGVPILNRKGQETNPDVISVHQVTIPKKFHLVEIARDVAGKVGALYRKSAA